MEIALTHKGLLTMKETHPIQHHKPASEQPPVRSKISNWKEEISFWKQEIRSLRRLTVYGVVGCALEERAGLQAVQQELIDFESEQIPAAERAVSALEKNEAKDTLKNHHHKVEEGMEQMRRAYMAIKTKLLPYFPKVVSVRLG